jgi:hypothetical protein
MERKMFKKLIVISFIMAGLIQISFAQNSVSPAVKKLAVKLAEQSIGFFPIQIFDEVLKTKSDSVSAEIEAEIVTNLTAQLAKSSLSDEKKSEIKLKFSQFAKAMSQKANKLLARDFAVKSWTKQSLEEHYAEQFKLAELHRLSAFFATPTGKTVIKVFNNQVSKSVNGEDTNSDAEGDKLFERFARAVKMPTFEKFTDVLIVKVMQDINTSVEKWGDNLIKGLDNQTKLAFKNEIEKFIAENIR